MAKVETIYLYRGESLASLIEKLKKQGVTDFSKVTVEMNYEPQSGNEDGYYYGPDCYSDIRLQWKL